MKRFQKSLGILFWVGLLFLSVCGTATAGRKQPVAKNGLLDLSQWNFEKDGIVDLNGEWAFHWNRFVNRTRDGDQTTVPEPGTISVPDHWNQFEVDGKKIGAYGYGSYRLRILVGDRDRDYALKLGVVLSACEVFVNGRKVASAGSIGKTAEETIPQRPFQIVTFRTSKRQVDLVFHVSNYLDPNGGIHQGMLFGPENLILNKRERNVSIEMFLFGSLIIMAFYHFGLYWLRTRDRSALFFGGVCLLWAINTFVTGEHEAFAYQVVGDYQLFLKCVFLSIFLSMPLFAYFSRALFPKEFHRYATTFASLYFGIVSLMVLVLPLKTYYILLTPTYIVMLLLATYAVYVHLLAGIRKRDGAIILLGGFLILLLTVVNDVLNTQYILFTGHYRLLGILVVVFSQSFVLSQRFSKAFLMIEQMSQEMNRTNVQLSKLDKLKDDFLANTSHELRTPLNGIIGIADSLIDGATGKLPSATLSNLNLVIQSAGRLSNLVNDILDFSKLRNRELQLDLKPVDVGSNTDLAISLLHSLVGRKAIELKNRVPADLPLIWADENRLQQILSNLLGNAIKFTHEGEITVGAELQDEGGKIRISVSDTGIGIPEDKLASIFTSFEQVDGSISREYGGTGLGLTITRQLVDLQGGNIEVGSREKIGSTFSFTLPVAENQATASQPAQRAISQIASPTEEPTAVSIGLTGTASTAANRSILVVDDEPINVQVLENQLSLHGYRILTAQDGFGALDVVQGCKPDLVILDLMMPRMNGYEVCKKIREAYEPSSLPIIILTAKNQIEDLTRGFECGANDYLAKPFSKEELLSRIKTHLELLERTERLAKANSQLENLNRTLEDKVKERTLELAEKNHQQNELVHILCHDLSNPFVNIKGVLDYADDVDPSLFKEMQEMLAVSAENGLNLINLVRELRALEEGKFAIELESHNLNELLLESFSIMNRKTLDKNIRIDNNTSENLMVRTEKVSFINSVLNNVLSNAIKFSFSGSVIEVNSLEEDGRVTISIRDFGIGMSQALQENLFDLSKTTNRRGTEGEVGTGFGMPLVKKFMSAYNGRIAIRSKEKTEGSTDHGTTIQLELSAG